MKRIFKTIAKPLSLILTKGESLDNKSSIDIKTCNGSSKLENKDMAVMQHYKPIIKI